MWTWLIFFIFAGAVLAMDVLIPQKSHGQSSLRRAAGLCVIPIIMALAYGLYLHFAYGPSPAISSAATAPPALTFSTGYLLELALSADNVMMFIILLRSLNIPMEQHGLVMFWAILLALAARVTLILTGLALISRFHLLFYFMGAFLLLAGVLMLFERHGESSLGQRLIRLSARLLPISPESGGRKMLVKINGRRCITPLLLAIVLVGLIDVLFAFDSIPAVFGITRDPLIVISSNVFAVLALHRLYFIIAPLMDRLRFLEAGLAIILLFIGVKMLLPLFSGYVGIANISTTASLVVILTILFIAAGASFLLPAKRR
jgi:tellurite resistance protein TerC